MDVKRVIITDHLHPFLAEWLVTKGFQVDIRPDITNEQLSEIISLYEGLVVSTKILVSKALIDKALRLEFIARAGSGMENIDVEYAKNRSLIVVNSPEGNANAVAEHAVAMTLALMNNVVRADRQIRSGIWQREENRGEEISGKTIGIIGFGHTGAAFSEKWRGFNVKILAHDIYKSGFGNDYIHEATLAELQSASDVISFHLPLNDETQYYLNDDFLSTCGKNIYIINTSRGKIVNTRHLLKAIKSGKVIGAALDVFENERFYTLEGEDLALMKDLTFEHNIILTPHVAGWTHASHLKLSQILAEKLDAIGITSVK